MNQAMLTFSQDPSSSSHELSFPFSFQSLKFMSPVMPPSPAFLYYLLICFPKYVSCFDKYLLLSVAANPAPPAVLLLQLPYVSLLHPCRATFWFSACFIEPFGSRHFGVLCSILERRMAAVAPGFASEPVLAVVMCRASGEGGYF